MHKRDLCTGNGNGGKKEKGVKWDEGGWDVDQEVDVDRNRDGDVDEDEEGSSGEHEREEMGQPPR